jgi:murein DD-endopeptidase MepM/ murein hydrolase activator NlpD
MLVVMTFGVLVGDWWFTRTQMQDVGSLFRELEAGRATIEGFNQHVAGLQKEVASWRELHARIWEPFGPDVAPKGQGTGIGGSRATPPGQPPTQPAPSEELNRLSESVIEEGESLRALERIITRAGKALASLPSRWPVRGAVNSEFGNRKSPWTMGLEFHSGMDISAQRGTPVRAPSAGTVAFAGTHSEYGLTVILDHGLDLRTIYGHLSKTVVTLGQKVERGTDIGVTGNTGRSSGPHLHYEILAKGRSVNPRAYLWE